MSGFLCGHNAHGSLQNHTSIKQIHWFIDSEIGYGSKYDFKPEYIMSKNPIF